MSTASRSRRTLTESERSEKRAADRERMAAAIEALRTTEGWKRWLTVRRHFRTYSFANQLLIAFQCPEATRVAGFRAWLKLGYAVRKGEKAIRIWAPCPPSKKQLEAWRKAGANPDDKPRTYFRMVPVFDRSQVEALPEFPGGAVELEAPHEPIEGDTLAALQAPLCAFAESIGSTVTFEPVPGAARGYYELATARIVVDVAPDFSTNAQVKTLIHELAHALVRHDRQDDDPKLTYSQEEVVAECVAYSVCATIGLDTSGDSVPYVAGWGGSGSAEQIERYAEVIDRLAKALEDVALGEPESEARDLVAA